MDLLIDIIEGQQAQARKGGSHVGKEFRKTSLLGKIEEEGGGDTIVRQNSGKKIHARQVTRGFA